MAANILRSMLDDELDENRRLKDRVKELELLLMEHDIYIPGYESWHAPFTMVE